ncbi:DUF2141 domain-containing protein [Cytophagales bacterium RKSG123]|nr:DUF2141 domain-containing protein [Xanthovirga aplysinae]
MLVVFSVNLKAQNNKKDQLKLVIKNIKEAKGQMLVAIFDPSGSESFPSGKGLKSVMKEISTEGEMEIVFKGLKEGDYAVCLFHDENSNGKLDANFIGIPTEPYGFSNDAKGFMGPPSFKKGTIYL